MLDFKIKFNKSIAYISKLFFLQNFKKNDIKYLCVGNPKTGTTSLRKAFEILGFKIKPFSYDDIEDYLYDRIDLKKSTQEFDFLKDWPWRQLYKEIDLLYPKCKFILTTRKAEDWVVSYISFVSKQKNKMDLVRLKYYGFDPKDYFSDTQYLIENLYKKENSKILDYFKGREEDLLILDVSDRNKWKKLCSFIGKPVPKIDFPHENKGW